jgi:hypothetical protein
VTVHDWYRWKLRSLYQENRELRGEVHRLKREARKPSPARGQTRAESALESATNIVVGLAVSISANLLVLPLFGYSPGFGEALGIAAIFTAISLLRSYALRRWFNRRTHETLD